MASSPASRSVWRRLAVTIVVVPMTLCGWGMLAVVGADVPTGVSTLVGLVLAGAAVLSWLAGPPVRRMARETLSVLCGVLSGLATYVGAVVTGIGVGAVGFMGSTPASESQWMVLSGVVAAAAVPVTWWLVRRELLPGPTVRATRSEMRDPVAP